MKRDRVGAVIVLPNAKAAWDRRKVIESALTNRVPTTLCSVERVKDGGLMAYTPGRATADCVDLIFAEQSRPRFGRATDEYLTLTNLKTAKALRLTSPGSVLLRAEQVIEWSRPSLDPGSSRRQSSN
jgi:hypothetical protein